MTMVLIISYIYEFTVKYFQEIIIRITVITRPPQSSIMQ